MHGICVKILSKYIRQFGWTNRKTPSDWVFVYISRRNLSSLFMKSKHTNWSSINKNIFGTWTFSFYFWCFIFWSHLFSLKIHAPTYTVNSSCVFVIEGSWILHQFVKMCCIRYCCVVWNNMNWMNLFRIWKFFVKQYIAIKNCHKNSNIF